MQLSLNYLEYGSNFFNDFEKGVSQSEDLFEN